MTSKILVINPGATSTKIAMFRGDGVTFQESVTHSASRLKTFDSLADQIPYRKKLISEILERNGAGHGHLDAVVGRGGILAPIPGGVYEVSDEMLTDARAMKYGEHASCLGPVLAGEFAGKAGCAAFIVDPVSTDEFVPEARYSGLAGIDRVSRFHALNQKAVARKVAASAGKRYEDVCFVVAHLGSGISVGAHMNGRVIDACDPLNEGSFSVDRAGGVPVQDVVDMCCERGYSLKEARLRLNGEGGVYSYLGTKDMREVENMVRDGNRAARGVVEAFAFQVAKDIGSMAAVCSGKVDRVIITGGMTRFGLLAELIRSRVEFIAPVEIVPGEEEMNALAEGARRVIRGEARALDYSEEKRKRPRQVN
ncbi:MAG: butyrate kinase [Synergistaceae bacterium]|jgi:butyrate kinase|nr:butyrate kinase [Synergistaceae bacterium]